MFPAVKGKGEQWRKQQGIPLFQGHEFGSAGKEQQLGKEGQHPYQETPSPLSSERAGHDTDQKSDTYNDPVQDGKGCHEGVRAEEFHRSLIC